VDRRLDGTLDIVEEKTASSCLEYNTDVSVAQSLYRLNQLRPSKLYISRKILKYT
jgi:hypothetical protein